MAKKLGKNQWRQEQNRQKERAKLSARAEKRAARKEEKKKAKVLGRWQNKFPKPGTKPSKPLPIQHKPEDRIKKLRDENVALVKKIVTLQSQIDELSRNPKDMSWLADHGA